MDTTAKNQINNIIQAICKAEPLAPPRKPVLEKYTPEEISEIISTRGFFRFCKAASLDNTNYWLQLLKKSQVYDRQGLLILICNISVFERQLVGIFRKYEGSELCYDKTTIVISKLKNYLLSGKKIVLSEKNDCSWGYPKHTLNNHESILMFFRTLSLFLQGDIEKYSEFLIDLNLKAKE